MPSQGRNELCACGSGKKYKHCCQAKRDSRSWVIALLVAGVIIAAIVVGISNARNTSGSGRVWSPEHGHYHDASGREIPR